MGQARQRKREILCIVPSANRAIGGLYTIYVNQKFTHSSWDKNTKAKPWKIEEGKFYFKSKGKWWCDADIDDDPDDALLILEIEKALEEKYLL